MTTGDRQPIQFHSLLQSLPDLRGLRLPQQLLELDLGLVATVTPLDLPENLRRWSEQLLMKPGSTKAQLIDKIEARLDLQDLLLPWTNEGSIS